MRPVEKKKMGEVVSYLDSQKQRVTVKVKERYSPYGAAKMPLLGNPL